MALKAKLDTEWADSEQAKAVFKVRALMENGYNVILETVAAVDAIVVGASFSLVDAEIKAEGQACRTIFNQAKTALATHEIFLRWRQP